MRVLITGASGLIGTAWAEDLARHGDEAVRLVRRPARAPGEASWDPARGSIERERLEGLDAVVHLAGENLAAGRWTPERKRRIRESRVDATRLLSETLAGLEHPPRVLISASGVNVYGDRGDETLTEDSAPGRGFLADVVQAWEGATAAAMERGIRTVHLRNGMVLSGRGGALARLRLPFSLGLGGPIAGGRAWWNWIAIDDVVGILRFAIAEPGLRGPVNGVAPQPVTNAEFTRALGRALGRPTWFPIPALMLKLLFGEMAEEVLLPSIRAVPARLAAAGYAYRQPELEPALRAAFGRRP
jgi:uncharacterized protein (TIGR01777 family)